MSVLKNIFLSLFLCLVFINSSFSQDSSLLDDLVAQALADNPAIQAAYSEWEAAVHKVKVVKGLPNPSLRYTYFEENVETRVGPQEKKYGASQKVPFPGKLGLKAKVQSRQAQILQEKFEATKREVIKNVKFIFYDLFWVDEAIKITEEEKVIVESLERVAQRRYESNRAPQQDVIKAQVELSKFINKLYLLRQNRKSLLARLNSILNRPPETELEKINSIQKKKFALSLSQLNEIAQESSQALSMADLNVERAEYEKSLAKMGYLPDFTFGFDLIEVEGGLTAHPEDGKDAIMGTISMTIPLWIDRIAAEVNEKKAKLEAARKKSEDVENTLSYEIQDAYFKITTYNDIVSLYKTALLPQAQQAYEAAKISYETGRVDFLNWLDAERVILQTRLAYNKAIIDYHKSLAYLERIIGKDL